MKKKALIFGITGQDGSLLADLLLKKNYKLYGTVKDLKNKKTNLEYLKIYEKIKFYKLKLDNPTNLSRLIIKIKPNEIYNLAGIATLEESENNVILNNKVNFNFVIKLLENLRKIKFKIKYFQALSSEIYGKNIKKRIDENSSLNPESPYAISKTASLHFIKYYRKKYNLPISTGILFNHESIFRKNNHVCKKICDEFAKINLGISNSFRLHNLDSYRDRGSAKDFVEAFWKILQSSNYGEFIIGTGKLVSIKEIIIHCCAFYKITPKWINNKNRIICINNKTKKIIITINKNNKNFKDKTKISANINKIKKFIKWKPTIDFKNIIYELCKDSLDKLKEKHYLK
jgi:GDPmannose 4,6-dehydratase